MDFWGTQPWDQQNCVQLKKNFTKKIDFWWAQPWDRRNCIKLIDDFTKKCVWFCAARPKRTTKLCHIGKKRWFHQKKKMCFWGAQEVNKIELIWEKDYFRNVWIFEVCQDSRDSGKQNVFWKMENWKMIYSIFFKCKNFVKSMLYFLLPFAKHSWKHKMLWNSLLLLFFTLFSCYLHESLIKM